MKRTFEKRDTMRVSSHKTFYLLQYLLVYLLVYLLQYPLVYLIVYLRQYLLVYLLALYLRQKSDTLRVSSHKTFYLL